MNTEQDKYQTEAEEVGCYGLTHGFSRNLQTHKYFAAETSTKSDGPFYCPTCKSDAVIRKCTEKIDHFAHSTKLSPAIGSLESDLHNNCKREICAILSEKYPEGKWQVERPIPARASQKIPELRPDISGRINNQRLAIEVQVSALSISGILKRCKAYSQRKIPLLWIVPLHYDLGAEPFRPRLYERYLHSIYFGRTYYWWSNQGLTLKPVHYGISMRHIEYSEWYEDGELRGEGGYDVPYKIIKQPEYGPDAEIDLDFTQTLRNEFTPENERKKVPSFFTWQDKHKTWWS